MTNEERKVALNAARKMALAHAQAAQRDHDLGTGLGAADMAKTWALVAEAMKDGDPVHDAPDGTPLAPGVPLTAAQISGLFENGSTAR